MKTTYTLYSRGLKKQVTNSSRLTLALALLSRRTFGFCCALFLLLLLSACQNKNFQDEATMMAYLQEEPNGYLQQKTINGIAFSLLYRPTDLLVQQELEEDATPTEIENLREKYRPYLYFNLSISKGEKELLSAVPQDEHEFAAMVQQLVFDMEDKIDVYTPQMDTLEMTDYIYPRMYGMSKATTLLLIYPRDEEKLKAEYLNLTIEDIGLYTGLIKFRIPTKQLKEEPTLAF